MNHKTSVMPECFNRASIKKNLILFWIPAFAGMTVLISATAFAREGVHDYSSFKNIPVLNDGRLKPLDTYARNLLIQLSGKDTYEHQEAIVWLARLLFAPEATKDEKVFLIDNPDIATALSIPVETHRRYSFAQMQKIYPKSLELEKAAKNIPEKERSVIENEILRVFENVRLYADLSYEFQFAYPNADFTISSQATKAMLGLPLEKNQFSFIDIALKASAIREATKDLENKSPSEFSADEAEMMNMVANLFHWSQNYKDLPLAVIPPAWNTTGQASSQSNRGWLSPWDAIASDLTNEQTRQLITFWGHMAKSYVQGQDIEFNMAAHLYVNALHEGLSKEDLKRVDKFPLELLYHASRPFVWARVFYIFAFIFFVISFTSSKPLWYRLGLSSIISGFILHVLGLAARIIMMGRPPVSNLYETFIFVSFITVFLGLIIERFNRQWLGIVTSAIGGTVLLFIAGKYSAEGDTLKMLIAVLNSNFWLGTHVTTITMGYGATCVGGVLGHIWLLQAAVGKSNPILEKTHKTILGILGLALTLTFLGTNLGGIWADQSWGRFWGWDPKENGALMIVLWTAMLFHSRVAKIIGPRGLAIGAVVGMMVVIWAWFGVNLLSIGLHSYGFTSGIAMSLAFYVICEIIFLGTTTWAIRRK
ncbi:MAG: cytochrome c biogenesis protein CcsA [Candidatus Omnitrophica bacterium]|nr:cytochrome c biogenesis protein CcsA [Candidatus Omnitrophota bacterium]